jgi:hypothetical protein
VLLNSLIVQQRKAALMYIINKNANTTFYTGSGRCEKIDILIFERALHDAHRVVDLIIRDVPVDIFSILGMRNLSAFVGELFARSLAKESGGRFIGNPHQDGYPDLLLMDKEGRRIYENLRLQSSLRNKAPFSPFLNGGIEIKATCGSVPTPAQCEKIGIKKPDMGEARIGCVRGYDWKAHHRETNNLVGLLWDFFEGAPHIVAVFFGSSLTEGDWGAIVQPKEGGGRTTSVSIMTRHGVGKMYANWIAVRNDRRYINFINRYNKGSCIPVD